MDRRLSVCHFRTPRSSRDQLYSQRWPKCHLRLGTRRRPTLTCPLRSRRQLEARFANMVGTDACVGAHHRSRSFDNCTTSTSANHQCRTNVASVFDRFGGCYWWGLYRFQRFSKSALYPPVPSLGSRGGRAKKSVDYDFFRELKLTEIVCSPRMAGPPTVTFIWWLPLGSCPFSITYCSMKLCAHLRWVP